MTEMSRHFRAARLAKLPRATSVRAQNAPMNLLATVTLVLFTAGTAVAGNQVAPPAKNALGSSPFDAGRHEIQIGAGINMSINSASAARPTLDDVDAHMRVGWMLNDPMLNEWLGGIFRGNIELLADAFAGGIVRGPGNYLAGMSLLLRYNYLQPGWKLVPYHQFGIGFAYSDVHEDVTQRLLGQEFEFNLQCGIGVRYLLSDRSALYVEGSWRHISNAGLANRNAGLNSLGVQLGVSYFW